MKKILAVFCLLLITFSVFPQRPNLDSLLIKIAAEKNDSTRFYLIFSGLTESDINPVTDMENAEKILVPSEKNNDRVGEVLCLGSLGYDYRAFGDNARSLEYNLKTYAVAEKTKSDRLLAFAALLLAQNYMDLADYPKAVAYNKASLAHAAKIETNIFTIMSYQNMGEIYLNRNKVDSALIFTQKAYDLSIKNNIKDHLGPVYGQLGIIEARMKNAALAVTYFNLAVEDALKSNSAKYASKFYNALAEYYLDGGKRDSAILYAGRAIATVQHTPFFTMTIKPAKLLLDIYRHTSIDSAFKYSEMHRVANDSLFSINAIQQVQLMTFEEDARRQELSIAEIEAHEQRKENIEYALIALGIVSFIALFLVLSRRLIINERIIEFFGVVALLLVFEFFNLLLHPVLEEITGHTPLLMLLALVCIAALLVPMHHKIEKWATAKLLEKNKQIRLSKTTETHKKK